MSNKVFEVREITLDEIPSFAEVVFEAFNKLAEDAGYPKTPDVSVVTDRLTEYYHDQGIPGFLYGGLLDGKPVGFFMLQKLGIDEEAWEISMLSVSPEEQRNGYGTKMLEYAHKEILSAKGVLMVCAVTDGNTAALNFFAKQEYESEASGIPVGEGLSIWMLRKDMRNRKAAREAIEEAVADYRKEQEELSKIEIPPEWKSQACSACSAANNKEE